MRRVGINPQDTQKGRPARPQLAKKRIVHAPYGKLLSAARTPLADFFRILLDAHVFRDPDFGFVQNVFEAGEAGKWKLTHRNRADFADRRLVQRRATAFFMDQYEHECSSMVIETPAA
jgi:hypothetical protein